MLHNEEYSETYEVLVKDPNPWLEIAKKILWIIGMGIVFASLLLVIGSTGYLIVSAIIDLINNPCTFGMEPSNGC